MDGKSLLQIGGHQYSLLLKISSVNLFEFEKLILASKENLPSGDFQFNKKSLSFVSKKIASAINADAKISVYSDYDADGFCSGRMLKEFIEDVSKEIGKNAIVDIYVSNRYSSGYGMSTQKINELAKNYDLIIGVDHGANIIENEMTKDKIIVFDHHLSNNKKDYIINPAYDGVTGISSGLVVGKFIKYFTKAAGLKVADTDYIDLEALTIISDMAELNNYARERLHIGLNMINKKERFCFKSMMGTITHKDLSFGVISKINAVGRMKDDISFVTDWIGEKKDYFKYKKTTDYIDSINDEKKKLVNMYFRKFVKQIKRDSSRVGGLGVYTDDDIPIGLNGLISQRLFQYSNKENVVLSLHNGSYVGSGRGYDIYNTLGSIMEAVNSKEVRMTRGGHAAAVGLKIEPEALEDFLYYAPFTDSKVKKDIEILSSVSVSQIIDFSELLASTSDGIPLNRKFYFSLEDYTVEDIRRYKGNYASVMLEDTKSEACLNCFLNLDVVDEFNIRAGVPLKINADELYHGGGNFKFSIESVLQETDFSNDNEYVNINSLERV